jgi:hypothetical protein
VAEGIDDGDFFELYYYRSEIVSIVSLVSAGMLAFVVASPLSRAFVPMRYMTTCPRCHYPLVNSQDCRCPECGISLPRDFLEQISFVDVESRVANAKYRNGFNPLLLIAYVGIPLSTLLAVLGSLTELNHFMKRGTFAGVGYILALIGLIMLVCFVLLAWCSRQSEPRDAQD